MKYSYLIDRDGKVLMQVSGPLKPAAGQQIVTSDVLIPSKLALYDPDTGKVVRASASKVAEINRNARKRREASEARADRLCAELGDLVADDPRLARVLHIVSRLPPHLVRRAVESAGEETE